VIPYIVVPRNCGMIILELFLTFGCKYNLLQTFLLVRLILDLLPTLVVSSLTTVRSNLCFGSFCVFYLSIMTSNMWCFNLTTWRSNVGSSILMSFESWSRPYALQICMNDLKVTLFNKFEMMREWKWIDKKLFVYMFRTLLLFWWECSQGKIGGNLKMLPFLMCWFQDPIEHNKVLHIYGQLCAMYCST